MSRIFSVKATVGEQQMAFVNTLKAIDEDKQRNERMKAMLKAVMEWLADDGEENNDVKPLNNAH